MMGSEKDFIPVIVAEKRRDMTFSEWVLLGFAMFGAYTLIALFGGWLS